MNVKTKTDDAVQRFIDSYVFDNNCAGLYQLSRWETVIKSSYGHNYYHLIAESHPNKISGVLNLIHIKSLIFGNHLISIPFFDFGGLLADNEESKKALIRQVIALGERLRVDGIELRHLEPVSFEDKIQKKYINNIFEFKNKVRMLLELPSDPQQLMSSFKSKLRSQIKKPVKEGLTAKVGGMALLEDFYQVFCLNMRDLGSPVHSKKLIKNTLAAFPATARIVMVYGDNTPMAGSVVVGFRETLENPWASSLREYSRLSPNMLLYWTMLEYACKQGYRFFDFGRSTPKEGTYKFKRQWGAVPHPLHWHYIGLKGEPPSPGSEKSRFDRAIDIWKGLPLPLTRVIGPMIRKYIAL